MTSKYEHQYGNSVQELLVLKVLPLGRQVVRVEDCRLDLVKDKGTSTKAAHHNTHGHTLVVWEPPNHE